MKLLVFSAAAAAIAVAVAVIAAAASAVVAVIKGVHDLIDDGFGGETELLSQHFVGSGGAEIVQTDGEIGVTVPAESGSCFDGNQRHAAGQDIFLILG